jgi:hypothetical protein
MSGRETDDEIKARLARRCFVRNEAREREILARINEPDCVNPEWQALHFELSSYLGPILADDAIRKARAERDAETEERRRARIFAEEVAQQRRPRRPRDTGLKALDAPLVKKMRTLIRKGKASSPTDAARQVGGPGGSRISGASTFDSKIARLVRLYKETYGG